MKPMLAHLFEGPLRARTGGQLLARRVIRITGRTESHTEEAVRPLYAEWAARPVPISATILASLGQIELHLSARARSRDEVDRALDTATQQVCGVLGPDVYSTDGRPLEAIVGDLLASQRLRIAVAESCTGGLVTSRLTDVAGSSRYVQQSVVAYANEAKASLLGIPMRLIDEHGAVSEPVASAMASGIRERAQVEVGVGITGIAGPGGGTVSKPVGTVAVAALTPDKTRTRTFHFIGDREQVKFQASQAALDMVRRMLMP
jgi:nicotinamide-nucleotide amidase